MTLGTHGRLVLVVAVLVLGPALAFYARTALRAWRDLHPRRLPVDPAAAERLGMRPIEFSAADGVLLKGWYRPTREGAAVLLVHGHGANRMQMLPEAELLAAEGYGVLVFDLRAHGESGGEVATSGAFEHQDVAAALEALRTQPGVDPARVGAIGFSAGGIALAEAAARDGGVAALVLQAAAPTLAENFAADFPKARPGERWTGRTVIEQTGRFKVAQFQPIAHLPRLAERPLLLVYGEFDSLFGPASRERMREAAAGRAQLWVVPGCGHGDYLAVAPLGYRLHVLPFLRNALLAPAP